MFVCCQENLLCYKKRKCNYCCLTARRFLVLCGVDIQKTRHANSNLSIWASACLAVCLCIWPRDKLPTRPAVFTQRHLGWAPALGATLSATGAFIVNGWVKLTNVTSAALPFLYAHFYSARRRENNMVLLELFKMSKWRPSGCRSGFSLCDASSIVIETPCPRSHQSVAVLMQQCDTSKVPKAMTCSAGSWKDSKVRWKKRSSPPWTTIAKIKAKSFFFFFPQHVDCKGSCTTLTLENFTQLTHFLARHWEFTALHIKSSLLENSTKAEISDCERNNWWCHYCLSGFCAWRPQI